LGDQVFGLLGGLVVLHDDAALGLVVLASTENIESTVRK
jgi:hypothetical protein